MALTGTVLFILSIILPIKFYNDVETKIGEAEVETKVIRAEIDHFKKKNERIGGIIANTIASQKGILEWDESKIELRYSEAELKQLLYDAEEIQKTTALKQAQVEGLISEVHRLHDLSRTVKYGGFFMGGTGAVFAYWGYLLWYRRIQKYQDLVLKNSAIAKVPPDESKAESASA
jgi:hypothetical protein